MYTMSHKNVRLCFLLQLRLFLVDFYIFCISVMTYFRMRCFMSFWFYQVV